MANAPPRFIRRVYPRACGGTWCFGNGRRWRGSLSPRVRGNLDSALARLANAGSIPARAGEPTRPSRQVAAAASLSPRVRGNLDSALARLANAGTAGLSPRVRGNRGLSCAGNWKSPFRRCEPIWAWRPSASGRTWPSPAPRPSCWASFLGPPWPPTLCRNVIPSPSALLLSTTNPRPRFWMPSPWCVGTCGSRRRVFHCPQPAPTLMNSPPPCTTEWWIPSLTPLELRKVQLRSGGQA